MSAGDLQIIALVLTAGIAVLNLFLIPLTKSAMRGEAAEMFNRHDGDPLAHPGLTMASREATAAAAARASEASAAALRADSAIAALRNEVNQRLDTLGRQLQELHEAFVEHDAWERARYTSGRPALRNKKGKR